MRMGSGSKHWVVPREGRKKVCAESYLEQDSATERTQRNGVGM